MEDESADISRWYTTAMEAAPDACDERGDGVGDD
jgi:hypothetical protein